MYVSELQKNLKREVSRSINLSVKLEYRGSYIDLQSQKVLIEIWNYGRWSINTFGGRFEIPLLDVATGNVQRNDYLHPIDSSGNLMSKANYLVSSRFYFQEIWIYKLRFVDLKLPNIQKSDGGAYSSVYCKFELQDGSFFSNSVSTKAAKSQKNPIWSSVDGYIAFKGPLYELEDLNLKAYISGMNYTSIVSLKGITTNGALRIPVKIHLDGKTKNQKQVRPSNRMTNYGA